MGAKASSDLREEEIDAIQKETGFSQNQIIRLFTRFTSLDKEQNGFLTRDAFLRIPELAINPIADRIVESFFVKGFLDTPLEAINFPVNAKCCNLQSGGPWNTRDSVEVKTHTKFMPMIYDDTSVFAIICCSHDHVNFRQFMKTLAVFRPISTKTPEDAINGRNKKLEFVFSLYDSDKDGKISKTDLQEILGLMVGANISPEQLSFIAERTILESDKDNDRSISRDEFLKAMDSAECNTKMSVRFLD